MDLERQGCKKGNSQLFFQNRRRKKDEQKSERRSAMIGGDGNKPRVLSSSCLIGNRKHTKRERNGLEAMKDRGEAEK